MAEWVGWRSIRWRPPPPRAAARPSSLPPSVHYGVETRSDRPMDRTGRAANTDVNCIPSRGKSQFCLESAMSERGRRPRFFREQSSRSLARRPPWSDAAGNASHLRCLRLRRPTTRVSSIISRPEERNSRIWTRTSMELSGAMAAAFLIPLLLSDVAHSSIHPSIESPLPSFCPIDSGHLTLSSSDSESRDRPTNDAAAICSVDFAPKVIESCAANIHPRR